MKRRIVMPLVLILGIVLGSLGTLEWCDRGNCSDPENAVEQDSVTTPAMTLGAGSQETALPTSSTETVPTVSRIPGSLAATPQPASCQAKPINGLAIIGDSTADEYQADNPRGGDYAATTFNWVEVLATARAIDVGAWGERDEPRRSGYAYNWARSGATAESMLSSGQHTGVAQQIQDGDVSHVIIQIGINNFYYDDVSIRIYDGRLQGEELDGFIDAIVASAETAVNTVRGSGDASVILAATQDYVSLELVPEVAEVVPDDIGRQRLIDAFTRVNAGLKAVAEREQIAFFDFNAALRAELEARQDPADPQYILIDGVRIDKNSRGEGPLYAMLNDGLAHPGTVLSSLFANLFITEMNRTFHTEIDTISDTEILRIAGLE